MSLREGRIILPVADNAGRDLAELHTEVQDALIHGFGGFTATEALGGWINGEHVYKEAVVVYDVAADEADVASYVFLDTVAQMILHLSDQQSVYVRHPNGDVTFVTRPAQEAPNARAA